MNSLLMDLKYKKIFAIQFAKVTHLISTDVVLYTASFSIKDNSMLTSTFDQHPISLINAVTNVPDLTP